MIFFRGVSATFVFVLVISKILAATILIIMSDSRLPASGGHASETQHGYEDADLGDEKRKNKFLRLMGSKKKEEPQASAKTEKTELKGVERAVEATPQEAVDVRSANEWEAANLGDESRKNKFLRLMGATKKEHSGKIFIGEKGKEETKHGSLRDTTDNLEELLEKQYNQGLQLRVTGAARRHMGFGYEEPPKEEAEPEDSTNTENSTVQSSEDKDLTRESAQVDRDRQYREDRRDSSRRYREERGRGNRQGEGQYGRDGTDDRHRDQGTSDHNRDQRQRYGRDRGDYSREGRESHTGERRDYTRDRSSGRDRYERPGHERGGGQRNARSEGYTDNRSQAHGFRDSRNQGQGYRDNRSQGYGDSKSQGLGHRGSTDSQPQYTGMSVSSDNFSPSGNVAGKYGTPGAPSSGGQSVHQQPHPVLGGGGYPGYQQYTGPTLGQTGSTAWYGVQHQQQPPAPLYPTTAPPPPPGPAPNSGSIAPPPPPPPNHGYQGVGSSGHNQQSHQPPGRFQQPLQQDPMSTASAAQPGSTGQAASSLFKSKISFVKSNDS